MLNIFFMVNPICPLPPPCWAVTSKGTKSCRVENVVCSSFFLVYLVGRACGPRLVDLDAEAMVHIEA